MPEVTAVATSAAAATEPSPPPSPGPGRGHKKATHHGEPLLPNPHGNRSTYLAARIARDAPEVFEKMKAGAFKSVRAAAKAAGVVKDPDPVTVARCPPEFLTRFGLDGCVL